MKKHTLALAILLLLVFQFINSSGLYGQTASDNKTVQAPLTPLSAFAGKYIFTGNRTLFLQITAANDHLVLKQLWDDQQIDFKQKADLDFYNDEHAFPLKFTKNKTGAITQVLAFDKDVWNKVDDSYKFIPQKTIQLTSDQLKAFEGKFELKGGDGDDFLQITAANDHLILKQLWDQKEFTFSPVSEVDFFNDDQTFPLRFTKGSDGLATQVLAFNKDVWVKVK
ncbi:MAG: hypothetical protein JWP78_312 [Mucilaginibacter sp.]|nr:hypothetical protein [Mucilaginibacter sp.]